MDLRGIERVLNTRQPKILVIHALTEDSRLTNVQFTTSFGRHATGCDVTYVNGLGIAFNTLLDEKFELGIVTYELLALRSLPFWKSLERKMLPLLSNCESVVLLPQDDYTFSSRLDDFAIKCNADAIYSPLTRDLAQIYPKSLSQGISFHEAFTGYIESDFLQTCKEFTLPFESRTVDLGQRVRNLSPQFGKEASKKGKLAEDFAEIAIKNEFAVDVSSRDEDVFSGDEWLKFLGNCRFTVSRKGGASIADPHGKLAARIYNFKAKNREATNSQLESLINENEIKRGDFSAISPRLFEAAAMHVCQILEEDFYVDGMTPWVHYLPIKLDMSNASQILDAMTRSEKVKEISDNAYELLIASGKYTYRQFVNRLLMNQLNVSLDSFSKNPILRDADQPYADRSVNGRMTSSWMQSYARRSRIRGKRRKCLNQLQLRGTVVSLDKGDLDFEILNDEELQTVIMWLSKKSKRGALVESYTWPWRSASYFNSFQ